MAWIRISAWTMTSSWRRWRGRQARCSCPGPIDLLNNGDQFYRRCSATSDAQGVDHDRGLHLLGRRDRPDFARAARGEVQGRVKVKILLDAGRGRHRGDEILKVLEAGLSGRVVQPLPLVHTGALEPSHAPQVAHRCSWVLRAAGIADQWRATRGSCPLARHAGPDRGSAVAPLQTDSRRTGCRHRRTAVGRPLLPAAFARGASPHRTS